MNFLYHAVTDAYLTTSKHIIIIIIVSDFIVAVKPHPSIISMKHACTLLFYYVFTQTLYFSDK